MGFNFCNFLSYLAYTGYGDLCSNNKRAGCVELLSTIQWRVKPRFHVFGHVHEGTVHLYCFIFILFNLEILNNLILL